MVERDTTFYGKNFIETKLKATENVIMTNCPCYAKGFKVPEKLLVEKCVFNSNFNAAITIELF